MRNGFVFGNWSAEFLQAPEIFILVSCSVCFSPAPFPSELVLADLNGNAVKSSKLMKSTD